MNTLDDDILVLELGDLGGHQAQHDLLAGSNVPERLKTTGAGRVKLQVERIDILVRKQERCDGIITALEGVGGVVVATAHVRINDQIIGLALDSRVVERHAQLAHLLQIDRTHAGFGDKIGIAVDAPGAVIKLDVAAARSVQVGDHRAISSCNGVGKLLIGLIDSAQALLLAVAAIERDLGEGLNRRRNGLARDLAFALKRLDKFEVLDERMVLAANGTSHHGGVGGSLLIVEHIARTRGTALDAVEPPHKVEVPIAATELAVGNYLQTGSLLLGHQVANGLVLDSLKPLGIERACRIGSAGVLYGLRTKKAADDISAKRRVQLGRSAHRFLPLQLVALTRQSMSAKIAIVKYAF